MKRALLYLAMLLMGILFVIPFSLMLIGSLRQTAIFIPDLGYLLASPTLANYQYVLGREQFPRWFFNSAVLSVTPVITQSFLCLLLGFIFARKDFVGKSIIFWTMIAMIMIPTHLMVIPQYILFSRIGWINTYWAILVPDLWAIVGVFFARQYLQTIPLELDQAAYMDGASDWQVFVRVIVPLCGPVVATIGTLTFISNWNELFRPLIFMLSQDMYPLMVGLASLYSLEGNFGIQMASATLAFLPTFTLFLFFQRFFTRGIQLSGLD